MSKIEIIVAAIIILTSFWGYRKGVIKMVFQLVSGVVATATALFAAPLLVKVLSKSTSIDEKLYEYIDKSFNWAKIFEGMDLEKVNPTGIVPTMGMPKIIQEFLFKQFAKNLQSTLSSEAFRDVINTSLSQLLMYVGGFLIALIIAFILLRIVLSILETTAKLPVIKQLNRLGGFAIGFSIGLLIVWIGLALLQLGLGNESYASMVTDIQNSVVVKYLYDNNFVMKFLIGAMTK